MKTMTMEVEGTGETIYPTVAMVTQHQMAATEVKVRSGG
jgi:hypothetical protein